MRLSVPLDFTLKSGGFISNTLKLFCLAVSTTLQLVKTYDIVFWMMWLTHFSTWQSGQNKATIMWAINASTIA